MDDAFGTCVRVCPNAPLLSNVDVASIGPRPGVQASELINRMNPKMVS